MDEGARLWLAKAVRKHYWRVSKWYDLDDLMQEGYFAYYYVVKHYPKARDPAHRMALFKLTFHSVITNLANQRTKRVSEVYGADAISAPVDDPTRDVDFLSTIAAEPDIAEAVAAITTAPKYVQEAIALFASPEGLKALRANSRRASRRGPNGRFVLGPRETLNDRLCRLTGYPAGTDIVGGIRACLEGR